MVVNRIKNAMSYWLFRLSSKHQLTEKVVLNTYRRYENLKRRREFRSRIAQIDVGQFLDVTCKPNLNVIILVVDSLRNSRLSSQGYFRETTPFLDSFGARFKAIATSSWTYPSVASILTGRYPHNHNAQLAGDVKDLEEPANFKKLRDDILTLPEILSLMGYRTCFATAIFLAYACVAQRVVPTNGGPLLGRFQPSSAPSVDAQVLLQDATRWIRDQKAGKFFAYIHLADLHEPLNPPEAFRDFFGKVKSLPKIDRWDFVAPEQQKADADKFQEYRENRQLLYDNTLRYVDHAVEIFHSSIKDMGLLDSTILVVTADHGEEFWDHAEVEAESFYHQRGGHGNAGGCGTGHGQSFFNELIEVPLLFSGPVSPRSPTHYVSAVDIAPTLLDLLGIGHKIVFDGRNIFDSHGETPLLSEAPSVGYEKKALVIGKHKLIYSKGDGVEWLFDLGKDPHELHPIVDREITSAFVQKLHQMLREDTRRKAGRIAVGRKL